MHIIKWKTLMEFYEQPDHQDAKQPLKSWHNEAKHAKWESPADIKAHYRTASILKDNRVVFNIAGNKYRLVARINYRSKAIFIRFIGTHREYDKIDAEEI